MLLIIHLSGDTPTQRLILGYELIQYKTLRPLFSDTEYSRSTVVSFSMSICLHQC